MLVPRFARGPGCLPLAIAIALALGPAAAQTLDEARELAAEGDTAAAISAFRAVATREEALRPEDAAIARNNACVLLTNVGRYEEALPECEAALSLRRALGAEDRRLARTKNNLGLVQQYLGRFEEGERQFRGAIALNQRLQEPESETINWANLALLLTSQGRPREALQALRQGQAVAERHRQQTWAGEQRRVLLINEGALLDRLGAHREALVALRAALADGDEELDPALLGSLELNIGSCYAGLGDLWRAEEAFETALTVFGEVGDFAALSHVWLNLGLLREVHRPDADAAEQHVRRALELARRSGDRGEELQDHYFLGRLLLERGQLDEARTAFGSCRLLAEASDSREGKRLALEGLGRLELARGQPARAVPPLMTALDLVEGVRRALDRSAFRDRFFGDQRELYAITIAALAELDRQDPTGSWGATALAVAQRAKVRDLLDRLGERGSPAPPLSADEITARLRPHEVLIEHFASRDQVYVWRVDRHSVQMLPPQPTSELSEQVQTLRDSLIAGDPFDPSRIRRLTEAVLPLGPSGGKVRHLRVSPDGPLTDLPFEVLLRDPNQVITYLPSGSALSLRARSSGENDLLLAGFAAPSGLGTRAGGAGLAPLPETELEVRRVSQQLAGRSTLLIGRAATEEGFRRIVAEQPRILHFATHTLLDDRPHEGPAILLTAAGDDDGELHAEEVASLRLAAPLVVLATCGSAQGPGRGGRALSNLSGAFLAAGASAVLATLWEVGDQAAATFMDRFYYELAAGAPAEVALHATKRAFRADPRWSSPTYWAPYVLIGDGTQRVLPTSTLRQRWGWAAGIAALAGTGWLLLLSVRRP